MKHRWVLFVLLLAGGLMLLAGCNTRTTSTAPTSAPAGPPAPTAGPTAPAVVPTTDVAVTAGPTAPQPTVPPALTAPQLTVQGTLASGIQWGTTSDGNYFKGDPNAPLIMFEFSDFQ